MGRIPALGNDMHLIPTRGARRGHKPSGLSVHRDGMALSRCLTETLVVPVGILSEKGGAGSERPSCAEGTGAEPGPVARREALSGR